MVDSIDPVRRSRNMQRITSKDTAPELTVRHIVRELGFTGYRLHRKDVPGKPDLAWIGRKKAIFVHGCFWHSHYCAEGIRKPLSNREYWLPKLERNKQRDQKHLELLAQAGWSVLVLWDCELRDKVRLRERLWAFLASAGAMVTRG